MNQNSTTKNNQENKNGYEGVFTRARAHVHTCAFIYAHTHETPKSSSRTPLFPLLMAFAVVMIVGVGNAWGQEQEPNPKPFTYNNGVAEQWSAPTGYYISKIECWGGGGSGAKYSSGGSLSTKKKGGGGGGGGGYAGGNVKLPQGAQVTVFVGKGGDGVNGETGNPGVASYVDYKNNTFRITANGGGNASQRSGGYGAGQASNTVAGFWTDNSPYEEGTLIRKKGGNGSNGSNGLTRYSGGGGAGAGSGADGGSADGSERGNGVSSNPGSSFTFQYIDWGGIKTGTMYGGAGGTGNASEAYYSTSSYSIQGYQLGQGLIEGRNGRDYGGGGAGAHDYSSGKGGNGYVLIHRKPCQITINFDANGGSVDPTSITDAYDNEITLPTPTMEGYHFKGWYIKKTDYTESDKVGEGGDEVTIDVTDFKNGITWDGITGSVTVFALWEVNTYNIKYDYHCDVNKVSGTVPTNPKATYGQNYTQYVLWNPQRTGYTFDGWFSRESNVNKLTTDSTCWHNAAHNTDLTLHAKWTACPVTVTFEENGGTVSGLKKTDYEYDEEYMLPVISKKGYHFDGWFTQATDGKQVTDEDSCNQSTIQGLDTCGGKLTLYAHWSVCEVKITYNLNYGSSDPTVVTVDYDKLNTHTIPTPTRPGYTFDGWETSSNVPVGDIATLEANIQPASSGDNVPCPYSIELTAQWTARQYTLTFDANKPTTAGNVEYSTECFSPNGFNGDGQFTQNRTYTDESEITVFASNCIEEITLSGYDFLGWYPVKTVTQASDTAGKRMYYNTPITANNQITFPESGNGSIDLYAHWKAKTYNIVLHAGTGAQFASGVGDTTVVATYDATYGSITGWENNFGVKKPEHTVIGWFTSDGDQKTGGMPFNGDEVNVTELFARWKTAAKVHSNGGTLEAGCCDAITPVNEGALYTIPVEEGERVNKELSLCGNDLSCITKTGYNLVGWYWESDFQTEVEFDQNYIPDGEFYADWTPRPVYVVFKENKPNGVGAAANEVTWNTPLNELANHICTTGFYDDAHVFSSDFNTTDLLTLPGYTFGGFFKEEACTNKAYNIEAIDVTHFAIAKGEDIDTIYLYAKWIPVEYDLVFHANNGTDVSVEAKVAFDSAYNTAHKSNGEKGWNTQFGFTKTGYSFDGWWLDSATDSVNGQTPYTCYNCTEQHLRAHWKANNYIITYNTNKPGSTTPATLEPDTKDVTFDSPYGTLAEPECDGYTFKGWYLTKALANAAGNDFVKSTDDYTIPDDTTLFAGWTANSVTVHFMANAPEGATATPISIDVTQTFDSNYILPQDTPTCPGYDFVDWFTTASSGSQVTEETLCTKWEDHSLYAHWTEHTFTVILNANGGVFGDEETDTIYVPYKYKFSDLDDWKTFGVSRTHYDLAGWFTDPDEGEGVEIGDNTTYQFTNDITLYAHWNKHQYHFSLNPNGGFLPDGCNTDDSYSIEAGQTINGVVNCIIQNAYKSGGGYTATWKNSENETINPDQPWTSTVDNQTFTAQWDVTQVTITLDPQSGTLNQDNITSTGDSIYTMPFWYGYYNDSDHNEYVTLKNVYGKWKLIENGGTQVGNQYTGHYNTFYKHENINYLKDPTRTGYFFKGWFTSKNYATEDSVGNDTELKKDYSHTIYAKWQPQVNHIYVKNCQVATYFPNTGECGAAYTWNNDPYFDIVYDSLMQSAAGWNCLSEIKRTGYRIDGWYWDENLNSQNLVTGTTQWNVANCPNESTNSNGVFYAHIWPDWQANDYTVTLHSNGGVFDYAGFTPEDTTFTVTFDQEYGDSLNIVRPERDDYVFRGWFDNPEGNGDEYFHDNPCTTDSNHVLYARWEPIITASLDQVADSCYGFTDGKIIVSGISGGEGEGDYMVVIKKGDLTDTMYVARPDAGETSSVTFVGKELAGKGGIPTGMWKVFVFDANHPQNYSGTQDRPCWFEDSIYVEEPELLTYDNTRADSMDCYSKGSVYVKIKGGTMPYTLTWVGSSGNANQQGTRTLSGVDTLIKQFTSQDIYLSVTDAHHCPIARDTVHVYEANNELAGAIRPITKDVCSEQPFVVSPVVFNATGEEVPSATRYSWDAPVGLIDSLHTGDRETTIHDSIHNNTNFTKQYIYEVTPYIGNYCQGQPFTVTVNVAPGTGQDITKVTAITADPESGCARTKTTLTAIFNHGVQNVTFQLVGYDTVGDMVSTGDNIDTAFTATFKLPQVCQDSITCIVSALDNSGCEVNGKDTLVVEIKEWSITATPGDSTVTCLRDVKEPTNLPTIKDGCDNILKPGQPTIDSSGFNGCSGKIVYTYTYTACDDSYDDWTFTYNVNGMTDGGVALKDTITTRPANVDTIRCLFQVPDLVALFRNAIDTTSTCTEKADMTISQTPKINSYITKETPVTVTVKDDCGRTSEFVVTVTVPTRPTVESIVYNEIYCYNDTTHATVTVTKGTEPYDYLWSNDSVRNVVTGIHAGSYTVTVTDNNGCMTYGYVSIPQPAPIVLTLNATSTEFCAGGSVVVSSIVYGGTQPYKYYWIPDTVGTTRNSTPIQPLYDTTTYSLYVKDAKTCKTDTARLTVNVNPLPEVSITPDNVYLCAGADTTLTAVADSGMTYRWDNYSDSSARKVSIDAYGTYTYIVTATNPTTNCRNSDTATVMVDEPKIDLQDFELDTICQGVSVNFMAQTQGEISGLVTYVWKNEAGDTLSEESHYVAPETLAGGDYVFTLIASAKMGECVTSDTAIAKLHVDTIPAADIVSDKGNFFLCPGQDSLMLSVAIGENTSSIWNISGSPDTNRVKVGAAGSYTVTVTDGEGCVNTSTVVVGAYPLPTVSLNNGNPNVDICPGQGTGTIAATPVTDDYIYYIWMRNGDTINNGTPRTTKMDTLTLEGSYKVKVIDTVGCYAYSNEVQLHHYVLPRVEVNNPSACESGTATLMANGAQTYTWSPTTYLDSINNSVAYFSGAAAGVYYDTVKGVDGNGCWDTAVARITVRPDVVLLVNDTNLLSQSVCAGTELDSIKFHVENGTLSLIGNLPRYVVFHHTAALGTDDGDIDGVTDQTGTFSYTIRVTSNQTDPVCPSKEMSGVIKVNPSVEMTLTPAAQAVCAGGDLDTVEITCVNGKMPETITLPEGLHYERVNDFQGRVYGKVGDADLTIPVTVESNQTEPQCEPLTKNITVTVHPNPEVKIADLPVVCPAVGTQPVKATVIVPTTDTYTYSWAGSGVWIDPIATSNTESTTNEVMANVPLVCDSSFALHVQVMDAHGCFAQDSVKMAVRDTTVPQITVLNNPVIAHAIGNCNFEVMNLRDSAIIEDECTTNQYIIKQDVPAGTLFDSDEMEKTVKVSVTGRCGHSDTAEVTVRKPDPVVVTITVADDTVCKGSSTTLTAEATSGFAGTMTYTWSPNTGLSATNQAEVTATPAATTTYTVTARDGNGCRNTADTTLHVYPLPVVTIGDIPTLCPTEGHVEVTAEVNPNGGTASDFIYQWRCEDLDWFESISGDNSDTRMITGIPEACSGTYTVSVEVTETVQQCKTTASAVITVQDAENPTITPNFATAWAVTSGGEGCVYTMPDITDSSYTYVDACSQTWTTLTQSVPVDTEISESTPVTVTATDACGNTAETVVWVNVVNAFEIDPNAITVTPVSCFGGHDGEVRIYIPDQSLYSYKVDEGDYGSTPTFSGLTAGVHYITVKNASGCTSTFPVTVSEPDTFKMSLTTTPATCANNDGAVTVKVQGGTPFTNGFYGYIYTAQLTYDNDTTLSQFSTTPAVMNGLQIGRYHVTVNDRNCSIVDSFEITLNDNLVIDSITTPKPICSGGSIVAIPVTQTPGTTYYTWPLPDQSVAGGVTGTTAAVFEDHRTAISEQNLVNVTENHVPVELTYHVTAHNGVCTFDTSIVMTVTATVRPQVVITPMDTIVCPNLLEDPFTLTVKVSNVYAEMDTLTWNFNGQFLAERSHEHPSSEYTEYQSVDIPASDCNKIYPFLVEYTDGVCASYGEGQVKVRIPKQFTIDAPAITDTIVNCYRDMVSNLPHMSSTKMPSRVLDGCGQEVASYSSFSVDPPFGFDCNGTVVITYYYKNCSGDTATYQYTYHVVQPAMELEPDGGAVVACESDAVMPEKPINLPDACGFQVESVLAESTEAEPNPLHNVVDGRGTVTYTFHYITCDSSVHSWRFVYTVEPEPFTPFDNDTVVVACPSDMVTLDNVPVPDTTICGKHIDLTIHSGYPQDVFTDNCGTRTYRYDYKVNGDIYEWYYVENVVPGDFEMPENVEKTVACYSEINVGNIPLPVVTDACGNTLSPVSPIPTVSPAESQWNKCTDNITCTYLYQDCQGHVHEWVYTWIVKDTMAPIFIDLPEVVAAAHSIENGNCVYTYPAMSDFNVLAYASCDWADASSSSIAYSQDPDPMYSWDNIEQTDEIQHLPMEIVATTGCGVSTSKTILVEVPAKLNLTELVSDHKNITCFGRSTGELRYMAEGGSTFTDGGYVFTINEPAAAQNQPGYFTNLPVPADSTYGVSDTTQLTYLVTGGPSYIVPVPNGIWYGHDIVTVTDAHGCNVSDTVVVSSPVKLEWENCPDTVFFCADPGESYHTLLLGTEFEPPIPTTTVNVRFSRTNFLPKYNVGRPRDLSYVARNACGENVTCKFYFYVLPNAMVKDSAANAVQEACPNADIDPIVFTFADADSIALTGNLPESMVSYETTQVTAYTKETTVTISGNPNVTEPTVYDYTFTAYSQSLPGSIAPCSEATYSGAITIQDTVAPTFTKPEPVILYADAEGFADTTTANTGTPSAVTDNCDGALAVTYRDVDFQTDCGGAYHFNRVWRVTDPSGNVSRSDSVQLITVRDTVRPVIAAGYKTEWEAIPNLNCNSDIPVITDSILLYATDNCQGTLTATQEPEAGVEILEDTDVLVTVTDACGNFTTTTVHVTASGVVAIRIDSVDAGCYHTPDDGAVYFTILGEEEEYMSYVDGNNYFLASGQQHIFDSLEYSDNHVIVVLAALPGSNQFCQSTKYFSVLPIAEMLTVTANSSEWEYDNAEHQNSTFTVKFGDEVISDDAASGTFVTLPTGDKVKATVTGAITDAGTVDNVLSDVVVMRGADTVTCKYNQTLGNGSLTVTPAEVIVTITGHNLTVDYDADEHSVSGYDVEISDAFYTMANFMFDADSALAETEAGTYYMNLVPGQFHDLWPTQDNIDTVIFVITDGYLTINKINATVNIAGHNLTVDYDGEEHSISGYETTFSTPLYTRADFTFTGDSLLTHTDADTLYMNLAPAQFANMNSNFDTVTFIVNADGFLKIKPIDVTVTVTGHNNTADYDGEEHVISGYDLAFSTLLYTANDFTFSGNDTAKRTDAGTTNMNLAAEQFANTNSNFATVTFNVTDGWQKIDPIDVTVTVTGHNNTADYDGAEHVIAGYDLAFSTPLYTANDFTFSGNDTAKRTDAGTTNMNLAAGQFANTNGNFATVTFDVTDGFQTINKINATVTITGHNDVVDYDGQEHVVSGYDAVISPSLYTLADFAFTGNSTLTRTDAGTDYMNLAPEQFINLNTTNFETVTFIVADDGYLTVNKIDVTVTITGNNSTYDYDGEEHIASGYAVEYSTPLYTAADFTFNGTAVAARTHYVEGEDTDGQTDMGLVADMFANTNTTNFANVVFNVTDGYQKINKINATVTITGHFHTDMFNGTEFSVSGYDAESSTELYDVDNDFTFTPAADAVLINGVISAKRTDVGTTNMGLDADQFANTNTDFAAVTFNVTDGYQMVEPNVAVVTITGRTRTVDYNGAEQQVTGYTWSSDNTLYSDADFTFSGDSIAKRIHAGTTPMGLDADQFANTNGNFADVTFNVTDGSITVDPIDVTVTIVGTKDTADYDGAEHTVTGYTSEADNALYNVNTSFTFSGTAEAARTDAGTTNMGLDADQFENTNADFATVTFNVTDGYQTILPIDVTVTVLGNHTSVAYDGQSHTTTGYTAEASTNLYKVEGDDVDFTFSGNATATRTNVDTTWMQLASEMFANQNANFATVTFNVTDGYQAITPIGAEVTIVGTNNTADYDGAEHTVTGYTATANTDLYDVEHDFSFSGNAYAARTHVVEGEDADGKTDMGLTADDFENTNPNFANVVFNVTDGYQKITPAEVTVTVNGHIDTAYYNMGESSSVSGYDVVSISNALYTENDFTFNGQSADTIAAREIVGTTEMTFTAGQFENQNTNFAPTFDVTPGHITILSRHATVTIVGNSDTLEYDGQQHTVTGYQVVNIDQPQYTENDFEFLGDSTVNGQIVGTYLMGLAPEQFRNKNVNYEEVTFVIERDGFVTITPKPITVTVTGHNDTASYDGSAHTVTGFKPATTETLYNIASVQFNGTEADSAATRTDAGTTYMGLAASQFANTDNNFNVTFAVTDGYQKVKMDTVIVTVTGMHSEQTYNGSEHVVTGYMLSSDDTSYDPYANVMFSGTASASRTDVGTTYMGLAVSQFTNTNHNYVVSFDVTDGYLTINPKEVTVTVKGNTGYFVADNSSHEVTGYTVTADDDNFDVNCITCQNIPSVSRQDVGTNIMTLSPDMFQNSCQNENVNVTITTVNGWIRILQADAVVVTVRGNCDTVTYDGTELSVSGYTMEATNSDYDLSSVAFSGTSTAKRTDAGITNMGLAADQFVNENNDYNNVIFNVEDGYIWVKPIDGVVVTVTGERDTAVYNSAEHVSTGYTVTSSDVHYPVDDVQCTAQAARTLAGTTYMGLNASQITLPNDNNFINVSLVVNDGYMYVKKKSLTVTSDTVFHKIYDGTPLTVSYDKVLYYGLLGSDEVTQGVITTESAAVGTYVCGAGQMWSYADNETGVANASGFGEPSVTQNYAVAFDVTLRIDPVPELNAPDTVVIVLTEGTADTTVTNNEIGTPENELVDNGLAIVDNDLPGLNPLPADTNTVTWTIYDTAHNPMATAQQVVIVVYAPCDTIEYNGYHYPAKRIGYQCWFTENLRTETYADSSAIADYHAYRDEPANLEKFGYLYTWYSAVRVAENDNNAEPEILTSANGRPYVQGACPEGWAVASVADYDVLYQKVGDVLLLKDAGEGYWYPGAGGILPNSGFNSRAGGFYNTVNSRYEDLLTGDHYWKSDSAVGSASATTGNVNYFCDSATNGQALKTDRRSVRCIKKW